MSNITGGIGYSGANNGVFARIAPTIARNVGGKRCHFAGMPPITSGDEADRPVRNNIGNAVRSARVTSIQAGGAHTPHRNGIYQRMSRRSGQHRAAIGQRRSVRNATHHACHNDTVTTVTE